MNSFWAYVIKAKTLRIINSPATLQMFSYFLTAVVGLVVDFGVLVICKEVFRLHYLLASSAGFLFGLILVFYLSNRFVFGEPRGKKSHVFILFGLIGVGGLLLLSLLMWLFTGRLGLNYLVSKSIATIIVFMWNFLARKALYKD